MPVTALYAALLAFLFISLSVRVIRCRRERKVELGDGEDRELLRRMRVQANCAEYVPIGILLIGLAESMEAPAILLHGLGVTLLVGRILHAYGLSQSPHNIRLRVAGMAMTLTALGLASLSAVAIAAPLLLA